MRIETRKPAEKTRPPTHYHHKRKRSRFSAFLARKRYNKTPLKSPHLHQYMLLPSFLIPICDLRGITPVSDCQGAVVGVNRPHPCPIAFKLMQELKAKIEAIPNNIAPPAQLDHPLVAFSGDPADCVQGGFKDDWEEVLNPRMKQAFGWGEGSDKVERDFAQRGKMGLDGFLRFVGYFVEHRGLLGRLIETKVTILLDAIAKKYMSEIRN